MTLILAGCKERSTERAGTWADKVPFLRISKTPTTISERYEGKKKVYCQGQTQKMSHIWQICLCCEEKKIADSVRLFSQLENLDKISASKSKSNFSLIILTKAQLQNVDQTSATTGPLQCTGACQHCQSKIIK